MTQDHQDHQARMMAQRALDALAGHQALCVAIAKNADEQRDRIEKAVNGLYRRWWQLAVAVGAVLLGMVASALYVGGKIAQISGGTWP